MTKYLVGENRIIDTEALTQMDKSDTFISLGSLNDLHRRVFLFSDEDPERVDRAWQRILVVERPERLR